MIFCLIWGIAFPLAGTILGAALVFFLNWDSGRLRRMFSGAAAGIMGAASLFGLLLPALALSPTAVIAAALGVLFLLVPGRILGRQGNRGWLVALAVVLHNIPEGLAAGVSFGSWLTGSGVLARDALAVGVGIGVQNLPDGAMVALPLRQQGMDRGTAFGLGVLSGLVEPVAAIAMLLLAGKLAALLPLLMGFAAGAMGYVVALELIPAMELEKGGWESGICFLLGLGAMLLAV